MHDWYVALHIFERRLLTSFTPYRLDYLAVNHLRHLSHVRISFHHSQAN